MSTTSYVSEANDPLLGHVDLNASTYPFQLDFGGRLAELEANRLPVGAVLPFFLSPSEIGLLAPRWLPADGRTVTDKLSILDGRVLPDLQDRTIIGGDATKDIISKNTYTEGGTSQLTLNVQINTAETDAAIKGDTSDFGGSFGVLPGNFVIDTQWNERAAQHNHKVKPFQVSVSKTLPLPPFRRLVFMVRVR